MLVSDAGLPAYLAVNRNFLFESAASDCHDHAVEQCFSAAGPRPGTGPWHQLYRAASGFPGICHFSFLTIFHE